MDIDTLRQYCLSFPHTTENVQWGYDLCFKVDGKLFAVTPLEAAPVRLSFKCSHENFAELCEREGVPPAPYMARAQWVALEQLNTLPDSDLRELLAESYRLVWERIPKKRRAELEDGKSAPSAGRTHAKKKHASKKHLSAAKSRAARAGAPAANGRKKSG
jgi:predicted DNA-binding protein (MmcQ/YjbR family)